MRNENRLLTVHEAACILNVSKWTVYKKIGAGEIPALRINRMLRIIPEALEAWIEKESAGNHRDKKS